MHTHQLVREIAREVFPSQKQMADAAGIQPQHLSRQLNSGEPLSFEYTAKIMAVIPQDWRDRLAIAFARDHFGITFTAGGTADETDAGIAKIVQGMSPSLKRRFLFYLTKGLAIPGYFEETISAFERLANS